MKKTVLILCAAVLILGACGGSRRYTRQSLVTDYVFSIDARGSGTAFALWWRNDSIAIYCFSDSDMYNGIKAMVETYPNVPAKGSYEGDGTPVETDPCYNIESSNVVSQTFKLRDVSLMICDKWFGWKPEERKRAELYAKDRNWPACDIRAES